MKPTRQQFAETLGECLRIIEESRRGDTAKTATSIHDFRNKPVSTRTDEQENARNLARQRRSLRIQANGYTSTGKQVPYSLQSRIDALNEQAELLKGKLGQ